MKNFKKNGLIFNMLLLTIFFSIWFPKAGIKLSGIPLTISNVLFGITFILWFFKKIKYGKVNVSALGYLLIATIGYCTFKYIIAYAGGKGFIESIGYIIPLIIYPLIFFVAFDEVRNKRQIDQIVKIIVYGFWFICFYSLLQYIIGINKCAIPGLTVNLSDYQQYGEYWYMTKSNGNHLDEAKIVSTYQNGNLFGIGILLIYPLVYNYYKKIENKKLENISLLIFILCTFLTLSRACWLGIAVFLVIEVIFKKNRTVKDILKKILIIILIIIAIVLTFKYVPQISNRFFNTSLEGWISMSGRTEGLIEVFTTVWDSGSVMGLMIGPYGINQYSGLAYEMFPLSTFVQLGVIGVILMYTVFIKTVRILRKSDVLEGAIRLSLIIWLIVGIIECGYWLPPAALNLFTLIGLGYANREISRNEV